MVYIIIILATTFASGISDVQDYEFAADSEHPYGRYNPVAPKQLEHFSAMIGESNCLSSIRIDQETWSEPIEMKWIFKYVMNGWAIYDEVLKSDGEHSGSMRTFNNNESKWYVHYFKNTNVFTELPVWTGGEVNEDLVFTRPQKSSRGAPGYFRLKFYDISNQGFNWVGEWVDQSMTISYPTWKIKCNKVN